MTAQKRLGVGILGAGPVTQAIHLPTLARMPDLFTIEAIMDVHPELAAAVAARVNARVIASMEELLADPAVDVVAICTPPQFHAEQVVAAMEAGKKAILCEKPYATSADEARTLAAAAERSGVPVLIGTMHVFDPGWRAVADEVRRLAGTAHTVRSRIVIPFNDRFEDWATEVVNRPAMPAGGELNAEMAAYMIRMALLNLTVHDLPLARCFLSTDALAAGATGADIAVHTAQVLRPFGYVIEGSVGDRNLHLVAALQGTFEAYWEFEAVSADEVLRLRFTPSFVHAGSAVATLERADGSAQTWGPYACNGYENEWRSLHAVVCGNAAAAPAQAELIGDLDFMLALTEVAAARAAEEFAS